MNWYTIFYWITVADGVKSFFDTTSNIFTFLAVILFIIMLEARLGRFVQIADSNSSSEEDDKKDPNIRAWELTKKLFYPMLAISLITWLGYMMTPTKKDCLFIVAGGSVGNFIQSDTSAAALPSDIASFLHLSLKQEIAELATEDQKALGVDTTKKAVPVVASDKNTDVLDKFKDMTKDEIIKYLENDTNSVIGKVVK